MEMHPLVTTIVATEAAVNMLFDSAKRMPEDKLVWSPLEQGRTALDQLQECATAPDFYLRYLDPKYTPLYNSYEEASAAGKNFLTLAACEQECERLTGQLIDAIRAITPDRLGEMHTMMWGEQMSIAGIAGLHYWNLVYHLGQINYIQTLYGDRNMF